MDTFIELYHKAPRQRKPTRVVMAAKDIENAMTILRKTFPKEVWYSIYVVKWQYVDKDYAEAVIESQRKDKELLNGVDHG